LHLNSVWYGGSNDEKLVRRSLFVLVLFWITPRAVAAGQSSNSWPTWRGPAHPCPVRPLSTTLEQGSGNWWAPTTIFCLGQKFHPTGPRKVRPLLSSTRDESIRWRCAQIWAATVSMRSWFRFSGQTVLSKRFPLRQKTCIFGLLHGGIIFGAARGARAASKSSLSRLAPIGLKISAA
jgi:hypothetical protein